MYNKKSSILSSDVKSQAGLPTPQNFSISDALRMHSKSSSNSRPVSQPSSARSSVLFGDGSAPAGGSIVKSPLITTALSRNRMGEPPLLKNSDNVCSNCMEYQVTLKERNKEVSWRLDCVIMFHSR